MIKSDGCFELYFILFLHLYLRGWWGNSGRLLPSYLPIKPESGFKADQLLLLPHFQDIPQVDACLKYNNRIVKDKKDLQKNAVGHLYEKRLSFIIWRPLVQTVIRLQKDPIVSKGCNPEGKSNNKGGLEP